MTDRAKKYLTILTLGVGGGCIYLIPYIRYVFYDYQIAALGITNQQLGLLSTVYAIGCMLLYIPGGMFADKYSAKRSILVSLIATSILTFIFAFTMDYKLALLIWFLFAISTSFLFWTSLFKTLRITAGDDEQGRMFGLYYAANGLTGAAVNAIAIYFCEMGADVDQKFFIAVMIYGLSTALSALLLFFVLKTDNESATNLPKEEGEEFEVSQVGTLLKTPVVWIFSLIVFSGYAVYTSTSYFTPYLTEVIGISPSNSGFLSLIRTNLMMLLAPVGGYLADKVFKSSSKWFMFAFSVLAVLYISAIFIPSSANPTLVSIFTLLPGAFGLALYGVIFSIAKEARIPAAVMGTAVGIASIVGYTPDFFMATMFGTWLDKFGAYGYYYIFAFLAFVSIVGLLASFKVRRITLKYEHHEEHEKA